MTPRSPTAELEINLNRLDAASYSVDLRSRRPRSEVDIAPVRGTITFDFPKLESSRFDGAEAAGKALSDCLFSDTDIRSHYKRLCDDADRDDAVLRVRLFIGASAPELHALKWELLLDPFTGTPMATRERVLFSRFLGSSDPRDVTLRPQESLRALVVIANPTDLVEYRMNRVDVEGELRRATDALGRIPTQAVTGLSTFSRMIERLGEDFDILYLVAHGVLDGEDSILWLEDAAGATDLRAGRDLVDRLGELMLPPRLVVLASCHGGDTGIISGDGYLVALGPRLVEKCIPAVVAMQGNVSMETVERFMRVFFEQICRDGQIERAMATARFEVKARPDMSSLVLFHRLTNGRICFAGMPGQDAELWPGLLSFLKPKPPPKQPRCLPILGSGLLEDYLGPTRDFARRWAERADFPFSSYAREDLPQVAQFLCGRHRAALLRVMFEDELKAALRRRLGRNGADSDDDCSSASDLLSRAGDLRRAKYTGEPHRVLATLPFPIYFTTNPDRLLVDALIAAGKKPEVGLSPWNEKVDWSASIFAPGREPDFYPSVDRPLVYHLFGRLDDPDSLVLTQDDYFEYLIGLTRNNELIPPVVRRALVDSCLLFLGFHIDDWDFRVVLRSLMAQGGSELSKKFAHLAVQIDPEDGRNLDPEGARQFLQNCFKDPEIRIYWGNVDHFARELLDRWNWDQHPPSGGRP